MLPGHQINLKIFCEDDPEITDIQWQLPGKVFKNYTITQDKGTLTELEPADLDDITVQFYWADVGDGRIVKVTFKADGEDCDAEATFNMKDPIVEFPPLGAVAFNPPPIGTSKVGSNGVHLVEAFPGALNGIVFIAQVTIPPGFNFAEGEWHYGQITSPYFLVKNPSTSTCEVQKAQGGINDKPWVYIKEAFPGVPPWQTGGVGSSHMVADRPGLPFSTWDQLVMYAGFVMYIMFKPAPDPPAAGPSAYVPLRRVNWRADFCAEKNGQWAVKTSDQATTAWIVEREHPTWSDSTANLNWQPTPCPGPCQ